MKNLLHTILGIFLTEIIYLSRMDVLASRYFDILYRNRQRTLFVRRYFLQIGNTIPGSIVHIKSNLKKNYYRKL